MFIRLSKLTNDYKFHSNTYINPYQIIWYGPLVEDENKTAIHFANGKVSFIEKSPKEVSEILNERGVKVWR